VLSACSKKETPAAKAAAESPTLPPEEAAKVEAQLLIPDNRPASAPPLERLNGAVHLELTGRLRMFIDTYGRMPESIHEFGNQTGDSMPPAPDGMKYVIDPADKTVKAVRK